MLNKDEQFDSFEKLGETAVRELIAMGTFGGRRAELAQEWLRQKGQRRAEDSERRSEASSREQIHIARSAKNAAWAAAIAAIIAAICAAIAIVLTFWKP
jgi:hypothetical protein